MISRVVEKLVDYYTSRTITNKIILLLVSSGIFLITQSLLSQLFEAWLLKKYNLKLPDLKIWGAALLVTGLFVLIVDIKFKLVPSVFATQKSTRIIYLGETKYQFVFDKRLRTVPTICFLNPKPNDNRFQISRWTDKGFVVEFEHGKKIEEIDFWADAWKGLGHTQRFLLYGVNLFRSKENKITGHHYEESFSRRQIEKINNT